MLHWCRTQHPSSHTPTIFKVLCLPELVPRLSRATAGHTQGQQFGKGCRKILEEEIFVLSVHGNVLFEFGVLNENNIGRQHHELASNILKLIGTGPWFSIVRQLWSPSFFHEQTKVLVGKGGFRIGP